MATQILSVQDIPDKLKAKFDETTLQLLVDGLNGRVRRIAPCVFGDIDLMAEAKLIILGALTRWSASGTGMLQSGQAGQFGFSIDTRQGSYGFTLMPSEEERLSELCETGSGAALYTVRPYYQPDPPQDRL